MPSRVLAALSACALLLMIGLTLVVVSSGLYHKMPTDGHVVMGMFTLALLLSAYGCHYLNGSSSIIPVFLTATAIFIIADLFELHDYVKFDYIQIGFLNLILIVLASIFEFGKSLKLIDLKLVSGVLLFNIFFLLRYIFPLPVSDEGVLHFSFNHVMFNYIMALCIFLAVYVSSGLFLSLQRDCLKINNQILIAVFVIIALAILLYGQLMWPENRLPAWNKLLSRPGGYFNPNVAAAIALVLMFAVVKIAHFEHKWFVFIALVLAGMIVLFSQSRASIIVLMPFLGCLFLGAYKIKYTAIFFISLMVLVSGLLLFEAKSFDLFSLIFDRFKIDVSSDHRLFLLRQGWAGFLDSPLWGNGYRHLVYEMGLSGSSHNEVIESLTNFGLAGFLVLCVSCYCFYVPSSLMFVLVCMAPMFMFSHNFFETFSLQASLGLALAADRYRASKGFFVHPAARI